MTDAAPAPAAPLVSAPPTLPPPSRRPHAFPTAFARAPAQPGRKRARDGAVDADMAEPQSERRILVNSRGQRVAVARIGAPSSALNVTFHFDGTEGRPTLQTLRELGHFADGVVVRGIVDAVRHAVLAMPESDPRRRDAAFTLCRALLSSSMAKDCRVALHGHESTEHIVAERCRDDPLLAYRVGRDEFAMFRHVTMCYEVLWCHACDILTSRYPNMRDLLVSRGVLSDGTDRARGVEPAAAADMPQRIWLTWARVIAGMGLRVECPHSGARGNLSCAPRVLVTMSRVCRRAYHIVRQAVGEACAKWDRARPGGCSGGCVSWSLKLPAFIDGGLGVGRFYDGAASKAAEAGRTTSQTNIAAYACRAGRARSMAPASYNPKANDGRDDFFSAAMWRFNAFRIELEKAEYDHHLLSRDLMSIVNRDTRHYIAGAVLQNSILTRHSTKAGTGPVPFMRLTLALQVTSNLMGACVEIATFKICCRTGCIQWYSATSRPTDERNVLQSRRASTRSKGRVSGLFDFDDPAVALLHVLVCLARGLYHMPRPLMTRHYARCFGDATDGSAHHAACTMACVTSWTTHLTSSHCDCRRASMAFRHLERRTSHHSPEPEDLCDACSRAPGKQLCNQHKDRAPLYQSMH